MSGYTGASGQQMFDPTAYFTAAKVFSDTAQIMRNLSDEIYNLVRSKVVDEGAYSVSGTSVFLEKIKGTGDSLNSYLDSVSQVAEKLNGSVVENYIQAQEGNKNTVQGIDSGIIQ